MAKGTATAADKMLAQRIRVRRMAIGMSQEELAKKLGVSFQQVQKYENGVNMLRLGRLLTIAKVLHIPVTTLIAGLGEGKIIDDEAEIYAGLTDAEGLRIARMFSEITHPGKRKVIAAIIGYLAKEGDDHGEA